MNCNEENMISKLNCICESCTPVFDNIINNNQYKLTPVLLDRLYNCTCFVNYQYNRQSVFVFDVAGSDYTYSNNGKVKINKISISYDNIGLPLSYNNSTKVYYNGELKEFTPVNPVVIYFQGVPLYLFNDLMKKINTPPICSCNSETSDGILIKISQKNEIFVTSNLKIYVYGCIDELPFSAVSQFDIFSTSQALGFSSFNINSTLCWPSSLKNGSIFLRYNPVLCVDSICPISNYNLPPTSDTSGYFYAVTNLFFTNNITIEILNNEPVPLLTNGGNNSTKEIN